MVSLERYTLKKKERKIYNELAKDDKHTGRPGAGELAFQHKAFCFLFACLALYCFVFLFLFFKIGP
jgi:hypothetical protein